MKRKLLSVVLAVCLIGAAGCGGQETGATESETQAVTESLAETESESDNPLVSAEITVKDVLNGSETDKIGEWAEVLIDKEDLKKITQEQYKQFCESVVDNSGYNWFTIGCEDGTGIQFTGSMIQIGTYGELDAEGRVEKVIGYITLTKNGYEYSSATGAGNEEITDSDLAETERMVNKVDESTTGQQKVVMVNSGWSWAKPYDYVNIYYAVEIQNPNKEYAVDFPTISITVKDASGKIVKNDEMVLYSIAADDTILYGNTISYEGADPATVEISVSNGKDNFTVQDDNKYVRSDSFVISNTSENTGSYKTYTGEITNNSQADFGIVALSVIYKKGEEIIGGECSYVNDLESGATKAFEISASSDVEGYDSYSIHAIQW